MIVNEGRNDSTLKTVWYCVWKSLVVYMWDSDIVCKTKYELWARRPLIWCRSSQIIHVNNITFECCLQEEPPTLICPWMSCSTALWREATECPNLHTPPMKCESHCYLATNLTSPGTQTHIWNKTFVNCLLFMLQLWNHEEVLGREVWK